MTVYVPFQWYIKGDEDMLLFAYDESCKMHVFNVQATPTSCYLSVVTSRGRIVDPNTSIQVLGYLSQVISSDNVSCVIYSGNTIHTYTENAIGMEVICPRNQKENITHTIQEINKTISGQDLCIHVGINFTQQDIFMCIQANRSTDFTGCDVMPMSIYNPFVLREGTEGTRLTYQDIIYTNREIPIDYSVMAFDIETHICPEECYMKDVEEEFITIIAVVFNNRSNNPDDWDRYILKWTDNAEVGSFFHNWDDPSKQESWYLHKPETIIFPSEKEMLLGFFDLVNRIDPDMIMGHNIFGFDFEEIYKRLDRYYQKHPSMSRIPGHPTIAMKKSMDTSARQFEATIIITPGRIIVDTWLVEKLFDGQNKISANKLSDLGHKYINKHVGKQDVSYTDLRLRYHYLFECMKYAYSADLSDPKIQEDVTKAIMDVQELLRECERYCLIDAEMVLRINVNMLNHIQIPVMSRIYVIDPNLVMLVGQGRKLTTIYYCIAISRGYVFNKNTEADDLISFVNKSNLPVYPNKKAAKEAITKLNKASKTNETDKTNEANDKNQKSEEIPQENQYFISKIKGGKVINPSPGIKPLAITLDFTSLYPSVGIGCNAGPDTYYDIREINRFDTDGNLLPLHIDRHVFEQVDEIKVFSEYKDKVRIGFVSKDKFISIMTIMFTLLFKMRKDMKTEMSRHEYGTRMFKTYNVIQNVYKILLNSIYGYFSPEYSPFQCTAAQAFITGIGRKSLIIIKELAEDLGWTLPGGDTDSIFAMRLDCSAEEMLIHANELVNRINNNPSLINTLNIQLEKMGRMIIVQKKNYWMLVNYHADLRGGWVREDHSFPFDDDGKPESKWTIKKGLLKKEAKSPLSRLAQERIYTILATNADFSEITNAIYEIISMIYSPETSLDMFVLKQKVSKKTMDPKSKHVNHVIYENYTKYYTKLQLGDHMKLVVCVIPGNPNRGGKSSGPRKRPYDYLRENPGVFEIDRAYYIHDVESIILSDLNHIFSEEISEISDRILGRYIFEQTSHIQFPDYLREIYETMSNSDLYVQLVEAKYIKHKAGISIGGPFILPAIRSSSYPLPQYNPFKTCLI